MERPRGVFCWWGFPATSDRGTGDPQSCPHFLLWEMPVHIDNATTTSRRVRSARARAQNASFVPSGGLNDVLLNFWSQYQKTEILGR